MTLRPVAPADAPALAAIHAQSFDHSWSAADLADFAARPGAVALLAETDDAAQGFILCWAAAGEAEILTVAVRPDARGRGLGRTLLEAALQACARAGVETLFLEVAADNAPALALYAAAGFEPAGRRPRYYARPGGPAIDALMLRRTLNSLG